MATVAAASCSTGFTGTEVRSQVPFEPPSVRTIGQTAGTSAELTAPTLRLLASTEGANAAFSPTLLAAQLAVLRTAASEPTATALDELLGNDTPDGTVDGTNAELTAMAAAGQVFSQRNGPRRSTNRSGTVLVEQHHALWVQRGTRTDEGVLDELSRGFDMGVRTVDFRSNPEAARQGVNRWADTTSVGRVGELVPRGRIDSSTRLVETGFTWLAAPWLVPFDESLTADADFRLRGGDIARVPMMRLTAPAGLSYGRGRGWQAVELPYLGRQLSMVVVVPVASDPAAIDGLLDDTIVDDVTGALRRQPVTLQLPRFAFTSTTSLGLPLAAGGAGLALDPDVAGFSRLAPGEDLWLDDIIQEVFMAADEQGTAAAAATVVTPGRPVVVPSVDMVVDQPFLVLVVDRPTRLVVLAGIVGDPRR